MPRGPILGCPTEGVIFINPTREHRRPGLPIVGDGDEAMNLRIAATAALVSVLGSAAWGFIGPSYPAGRSRTFHRQTPDDNRTALQKKSSISDRRLRVSLRVEMNNGREDSNDQLEELPQEEAENFDGKGFVGYLAPYAFAFLVASIVTGLFFKFVLMADY